MRKKMIFFSIVSFCLFFAFNEVLTMRENGGGRGRGCRNGSGPRAQRGECPRLKDDDSQERMLKRDGTGPKQDGKGPRCTDIGPREDCPKRK